MKIVHLSTHDIEGGAARSAYRLHVGLRQLGYESLMLVAEKKSYDPSVIAFAPPTGILNRLTRRLRHDRITRSFSRYHLSRPEGYERFSDDRSLYGGNLASSLPPCDVIHLRSVSSFVGSEVFHRLPGQTPLVWTLDDMNPLTGGCHFDDECGRFSQGCGACPQLGSTDSHDLAHQIWQRKRRLFSRIDPSRLQIVATNRWMERLARHSPLLSRFPVTVIPYGLDTDTFLPRPKIVARLLLGVPENAFVILFVAQAVNLRRKGLPLLVEALRKPIGDDILLLSIGNGAPDLRIPVPTKHINNVDNDWVLSCIYSAADIFVCPSVQDNLPNTVMEAMACGTPVVAFDAGGIPDMVRPEITGLLASTGDTQALRASIAHLHRDRTKRAAMGENSRTIALQEYSLEVQARRYAALYETVLWQLAPQQLPSLKT